MGILSKIKKNLGSSSTGGSASGGEKETEAKESTTLKEKAAPAAEKAPKASKKEEAPVLKSDTKDAYRILVRPLVTEKSTELANQGKYVFAVDPSANKHSVARAVKSLYDVTVADVNMVNVRGKVKTFGRNTGKRKNIKKAIVTLAKGQKITVFEGV